MRLAELIEGVAVERVRGDSGPRVTGLAYDNRSVEPGSLFFCVRGLTADGHEFAPDAVERGAAALVVDRELDLDVPQVVVADVRASMPPLAVRFFGDPTAELSVVGVTGTNGKTTTAFLVRGVLEATGTPTGLLGTVKRIVGRVEEKVVRTTPEAIDLQATFRRMRDAGDRACVMEVSSHALALGRAAGIRFDVKVFTNLTQDHLDFHADMEDYFAAKRSLFEARGGDEHGTSGTAVINADDPYGRRLIEDLREAGADLLTYSAQGAGANLTALDVETDFAGARFRCLAPSGEARVETSLPGEFNVANALGALAAATALGVDLDAAVTALGAVEQVPGRFEPIDEGQPFAVLVDYAHTPDSLENVLRAAGRMTEERLICVFGCGGDRDRDKRPLMGEIAAELSDVCIVTSDNPRGERPEAIIAEILAGIHDREAVAVEPDRRAAIALALAAAKPGDTVLIAGKGHEQGQEFEQGRKLPFDDREVAADELRRLRTATP